MILDALTSAAASVGRVDWPDGRTTLVCKIRLALGRSGAFEPVEEDEGLLLDVFDRSGQLVYPSDFAPYKPSCDVVIVGADALDRAAPGELRVGRLVRTVDPNESVGPRELFCEAGDPTHPAAVEAWARPGMDFARFQSAPPSQRMPWPTSSFHVAYSRGANVFGGVVPVIPPGVTILDRAAVQVRARITMQLDAVLLRPAATTLTLVYRGLHDRPGDDAPELALFDTRPDGVEESLPWSAWRRPGLSTPVEARMRVAEAQVQRSTASIPVLADAEATAIAPAGASAGPALPFVARSEPQAAALPLRQEEATREETSPVGLRTKAKTLPFAGRSGGAEAPRRELDVDAFAALRAAASDPVPAPWGAESTATGPYAPGAPTWPDPSTDEGESLRGQGIVAAPPVVPPPAVGVRLSGMILGAAVAPAATPDVPLPVEEAPPVPSSLPDAWPIARCAAIAASLDRSPQEVEAILARDGLVQEQWDAIDSHWRTAIADEAARARDELARTWDQAYVARLEAERGPITVDEYARLEIADERGDVEVLLAELGLPLRARMSIERVWLERTSADVVLAKQLRLALKVERAR